MFEEAEVGNSVFDLIFGKGVIEVIETNDQYPIRVEFDNHFGTYMLDGRYQASHKTPRLYWSKPVIIAPPKPKKMVWKKVEGWVNIYPYGIGHTFSSTEAAANSMSDPGRIACVFVYGEYEKEE